MLFNRIKRLYPLIGLLLLTACSGGEESFIATGSFEAQTVLVSSEANGRILWWAAKEGQTVEEGQILGAVDSTQLYLEKLTLLANADAVRAASPNVEKQTAALDKQLDKLRQERVRTERLLAAQVANQKQLDDIDAQIGVIESQRAALQSQLTKNVVQLSAQSSAMDIQVAKVQYQLDRCQLRSPIAGTILQSYVSEGELAAMGYPLFKVARMDTMQLRAYVPYPALTHMKLGDTVNVQVDRGTGKMARYQGQLQWISESAEFTPKTVQTKSERDNLMYAVKVAVPNDGYIKVGMYGELHLTY